MNRFLVLGSIAALIAACSSRTTTYGAGPSAGGSAGTGGSDSDGGTSSGGKGSGGKGSGGASSGGTAGKGSGGTADGGAAGSGEAGMGGEGGSAGADDCPAAGCPQSCDGLPNNCGPDGDQNCCASIPVAVGTFAMGRSDDGTDAFAGGDAEELPEHTANVIDLRIDTYEVTLSRFMNFIDASPGSFPAEGDGAHPGIPNSGWKAEWDPELESATITLQCGFNSVYKEAPDPLLDPKTPINCLTYYLAFAFCAWDGGFLPTEADWEAVATGGAENRLYPWGTPAPDETLANFNCQYDPDIVCDVYFDVPVVGTFPNGRGRYGHHDLAGSVSEWVFDAFTAGWYAGGGLNCTNCANLDDGVVDTNVRVMRGGNWQDDGPGELRAQARVPIDANDSLYNSDVTYGVRCARPL